MNVDRTSKIKKPIFPQNPPTESEFRAIRIRYLSFPCVILLSFVARRLLLEAQMKRKANDISHIVAVVMFIDIGDIKPCRGNEEVVKNHIFFR